MRKLTLLLTIIVFACTHHTYAQEKKVADIEFLTKEVYIKSYGGGYSGPAKKYYVTKDKREFKIGFLSVRLRPYMKTSPEAMKHMNTLRNKQIIGYSGILASTIYGFSIALNSKDFNGKLAGIGIFAGGYLISNRIVVWALKDLKAAIKEYRKYHNLNKTEDT